MSVFDNLTSIPCDLTAGEAITWTESPTDYPPASYKLFYDFAGQTPVDGFQKFTIEGTEAGSEYTFTMPATVSPGIYQWQKRVVRSSDSRRAIIGTGRLRVMPNLSLSPTLTKAAQMLAAAEAALLTLASDTTQSVSFNGQSFTQSSRSDLIRQRNDLRAEVYREQQALLQLSGEGRSSVVGMRFVRNGCGVERW